MKIKLFTIFIILNFNAYNQAPNWKWATGSGGLADEYIEALTIDSDNNTIIIGQYFDDNMILCNQNIDGSIQGIFFFIAKYSNAGSCDWVRAFGNENNYIAAYNIDCDQFGNIYVVGGYTGKIQLDQVTVENKKLALDGILIKFNPEGKVLFVKTFDGNDYQAYLLNIKLDKLGNIFVSGITNSSKVIIDNFEIINPRKSGGGNGTFLIKFDTLGVLEWSNISFGQGGETTYGLEIDNNGELLLAGFYGGSFDINDFVQFDSVKLINKSNTTKYDIFLYKFDTSGKAIWGRSFGDSNFDEYTGIIKIDSKNNIYLSGTFASNQFFFGKDTLNKIASSNLWDYILMKFDSNGNPIQAKNYFFGHSYFGFFNFAINNKDEISMHFIVSDSIIKVGNESYKNFSKDRKGLSDFDNLILTIDNSGNYLWSKHYGSELDDQASSIEYNKNEELIVCGDFDGARISFGNDTLNNLSTDIGRGIPRNIFIAKLSYDTTTSINIPILKGEFILYPNPVIDILTLVHNFENSEFLILSAFDITGRQFELEYYLNDNRISIDTRKLANGIYFIALKAKYENSIEKFVVQH